LPESLLILDRATVSVSPNLEKSITGVLGSALPVPPEVMICLTALIVLFQPSQQLCYWFLKKDSNT
jgi:hypothetical protein